MTDDIARIAYDEARRAAGLAHDARNALTQHELDAREKEDGIERRADKFEWDLNAVKEKVDDDCDRITAVEKEQQKMQSAVDKLARSVDRLTEKLPPAKSATQITREMWRGTSRRGKAGLVAVLTIVVSPPAIELAKVIAQAIGQVAQLLR